VSRCLSIRIVVVPACPIARDDSSIVDHVVSLRFEVEWNLHRAFTPPSPLFGVMNMPAHYIHCPRSDPLDPEMDGFEQVEYDFMMGRLCREKFSIACTPSKPFSKCNTQYSIRGGANSSAVKAGPIPKTNSGTSGPAICIRKAIQCGTSQGSPVLLPTPLFPPSRFRRRHRNCAACACKRSNRKRNWALLVAMFVRFSAWADKSPPPSPPRSPLS